MYLALLTEKYVMQRTYGHLILVVINDKLNIDITY